MPLGHDLFQLPEAERIPEIPADAEDDDLGFEMSPFEQRWPLPCHAAKGYQTVPSELATLPS
jgi:hypothetical protein